jgi:aminoglycoside 6'-N-acetyltransferase
MGTLGPPVNLIENELISFRPMTEADLSLLERWLAADHVIPWWGPAPTSEQVRAHYLPYIRHEQPVDAYLVLVDGTPVGYIQAFRVADWPAYWPQGQPFTSEPNAAGIDLLIGKKELLGQGLGTLVIRQFVYDVVLANPEVSACYADPAAENHSSLAALRKAGFVDVGSIGAPGDATPRRLLRLAREGTRHDHS